jgi:hypothetical protein
MCGLKKFNALLYVLFLNYTQNNNVKFTILHTKWFAGNVEQDG